MSFCFLCQLFPTTAQVADAEFFTGVDHKVYAFSKLQNNNFDSLVKFVKQNFGSEKERVRAFYTWIAVNISYDMELLENYKVNTAIGLKHLSSLITQSPDTVLKYKKAVCEGYALLMNKCCETCSITSKMVVGPTKLESGEVVEGIFHAWNAVKTDGVWHLLDVSWANGYVNHMNKYHQKFSDKYFFPEPQDFGSDHWPFDPIWQLQKYPVTKEGFYRGTESRSRDAFSFNDSIASYLTLQGDSLEYATFSHYHAFDMENPIYTKECDRIIHDRLVNYMNLAAVYFDDYQQYIAKQRGKQISEKLLKTCIRLLQAPKKYLEIGLKYSENRFFYNAEIKEDFEKMISSAKLSMKEVEFSLDNYRNMSKALKANKK